MIGCNCCLQFCVYATLKMPKINEIGKNNKGIIKAQLGIVLVIFAADSKKKAQLMITMTRKLFSCVFV